MAESYTLSCTLGVRRATSYNGTYYVINSTEYKVGRYSSFYWGLAIDSTSGSYPNSSVISSAKIRLYVGSHGTSTVTGRVRLYERYYDSGYQTSTVAATTTSVQFSNPGSYVEVEATAHVKAGIDNFIFLPNVGTLSSTAAWFQVSRAELVITTTETTYSLSYNANGGSGAPSSQSATTATGSATFTISSTKPTRQDYKFLGWNTNQNATTAQYQSGSRITITASTTLYAIWETLTVKIEFRSGNGTNQELKVVIGETYGLGNVTTPQMFGYVFKGWGEAANQWGVESVWNDNTEKVANEAKTWYAVWCGAGNVFQKNGTGMGQGKSNGLLHCPTFYKDEVLKMVLGICGMGQTVPIVPKEFWFTKE